MRLRAAVMLMLALAVLNLAAPGRAAAAIAKLTGGAVTPTTGTTATTFQFSVHFVGTTTDQAVAVSASVAGRTVPLSLSSGSARNGTWTGSSTLPAGSWKVTYQSTSTGLTNPRFVVPGQVVVTTPTPPPTPSPTPRPSPKPTPRPTPRPTAVPATAIPRPATSLSPGASPTPSRTTVPDPTSVPSTSESAPSSRYPSASPGPSTAPSAVPPGSRPFDVPLEGVVAIGLLGAVAVAAALGERRRRLAVEAFREQEASAAGAPPPQAIGAAEGWDDDIVSDETVGTIDYEAPEEPLDPDPANR